MAIPVQYGIAFTPAEETTIITAFQSVLVILQAKANFNMTNEERGELSKVGDERLPYVLKSISDYAVQFPNLNGLAHPIALANIDLSTYGFTGTMTTTMTQLAELTEEIRMVAGHFAYAFMLDQYYNAERYRGDNVAGAQVVYDGLKGCFEGMGPQPD